MSTLLLALASVHGWSGPGSAAEDAAVALVDVAREAGITFVHESGATDDKLMVETFGSGVAWIDYDNDGFLDLYFVNGAAVGRGTASPGNVLYRHDGRGRFTDVTPRAAVAGRGGYGTGVAVGDYDNDGWLDLYVANLGPNILYHNNRDGTFTDVTAKAGVAGGAEWSSSAGFFDYDRDGDLDLYVVNYVDFDAADNPYCGFKKPGYRMYCSPTVFDGVSDRLFRNDGDGTFTDVSTQAGIANPGGKGLGVTFCDVNGDGYVDVYVANDLVRNFLYRNNRDGTFTDEAYGAGVGYDLNGKPQAGMGTDCGDVNGDGLQDLFVTNFSAELDTLYINHGDLLFEDSSEALGLGSSYWPLGFGTRLFDVDNDGDLDIYVANGHVIDNIHLYQPRLTHAQRDLLHRNDGGRFTDISAQAGPGLDIARVSRGLAVGDYNNDGALDVAISNLGGRPVLLRNASSAGRHWLLVEARGRRSNRFGLGASVRVETAQGVQVRAINNTASYLSSNDIRLHFGLGDERRIKKIEVRWPSGAVQVLEGIEADQILRVEEP
ncbi:MAG: CRTAC1 family protein [Vicinamibacteraceae bacterium]